MTALGPTQRVLLLLDLVDIVAERMDSISYYMNGIRLSLILIFILLTYLKLYLLYLTLDPSINIFLLSLK